MNFIGTGQKLNNKVDWCISDINATEASIRSVTNTVQGRSWSGLWHATIIYCTADIEKYPPVWRRGAASRVSEVSEVFQQQCSDTEGNRAKNNAGLPGRFCVSLMWVQLIQIHDMKAIKTRSKREENKRREARYDELLWHLSPPSTPPSACSTMSPQRGPGCKHTSPWYAHL